jgi:tRNA nucleotidyltransferase/poly(A) polymerase
MAKIEKETSDSIIKNGYLLENLSRERIWDEIKKSYSQSKDFNEYLKYLSDFNLMQYIFPGAVINTKIEECHNFVTYIANLFKFEDTQKLENKMILEYKIEGDIAAKAVFLIDLLNLTTDNVFDLYKKKIRCHVTNLQIIDWLDTCGITGKIFIRFIDYVPSVSAEDLMSKGFKGKNLGDEIKRLEIENFKSMM